MSAQLHDLRGKIIERVAGQTLKICYEVRAGDDIDGVEYPAYGLAVITASELLRMMDASEHGLAFGGYSVITGRTDQLIENVVPGHTLEKAIPCHGFIADLDNAPGILDSAIRGGHVDSGGYATEWRHHEVWPRGFNMRALLKGGGRIHSSFVSWRQLLDILCSGHE